MCLQGSLSLTFAFIQQAGSIERSESYLHSKCLTSISRGGSTYENLTRDIYLLIIFLLKTVGAIETNTKHNSSSRPCSTKSKENVCSWQLRFLRIWLLLWSAKTLLVLRSLGVDIPQFYHYHFPLCTFL